MRHQHIEGALADMHAPEQLRRDHRQHQPHSQRQRGGDDHHQRQPVALKQPRERARPGEFGPCLGAPLCKRQRHIDGEFMRRRILAGMIAGPAMMAEIGKLRRIADIEQAAAFHRRKDGAEPLAIAAGIADLHDPGGFLMRRRAGELDQADIIHVTLSLRYRLRLRAASAPAMRPKTAPMVMPIPAR